MSDRLSDVSSLFAVKGLVAVVTGGGTGIGLMIAKALEHNGAIVYIVSRRLAVLEDVARQHNKHGNLIAVACDVTSQESILALVETVKARHGFINLLINNAGVANNILPKLPIPGKADIKTYQQALWNAGTSQKFAESFQVNTSAVWYTTIAFMELLDAGNKKENMKDVPSQVISITSGGGFRKDDKVFSMSYTLSKTAATHLGKMLAHFLKDWNIRSNVVCPGIFPSNMTEGIITQEYVDNGVPLKRAGRIDDIGGIILFLASKAGAYVNGSVHLLDGGRLTLYPSTY